MSVPSKETVDAAVARETAKARHVQRPLETERFSEHNTDPITLTRFIMHEAADENHRRASLAAILQAIATASKVIANAVQRAGVQGLYALGGDTNVHGEDQKKLDVLSNDVFVNALMATGKVSVMISEENPEAIIVEGYPHCRYAVVFDPLDGSSNIECNVSVGSIFGIYHQEVDEHATVADALQPGSKLVAAGYVLYSSAVCMVVSTNGHKGIYSFTLDPNFGEFVMTKKNMQIPESPKEIYSVNSGNCALWDEATRGFVDWATSQKKPYSARYIGSMVSDVHRTLLYGGVFMYPADAKSPKGKLRLLYECNPMAYLVEKAGGMATDGRRRILHIQPTDLHERSPIFIGCKRDVQKIMDLYAAMDAKQQPKA